MHEGFSLGLWCYGGRLVGGCHRLTLEEFFYCYKYQQIVGSKGFFNFVVHKPSLKLVSDMPNSNCDWNSSYFLFRARTGHVGPTSGIA